jgi:hypothetical protein
MRMPYEKRATFVLAAAVILGCCLAWIIVPPRRFTRGMYDRIGLGMELEEVVTILGVPPGKYATDPEARPIKVYRVGERSQIYVREGVASKEGTTSMSWLGDYGEITLQFDVKGEVNSKAWRKVWTPAEDSWIKWTLRRAELMIRCRWSAAPR